MHDHRVRRPLLVALLATLLGLLAPLLVTQVAVADSDTATISGRVLDEAGAPVAGRGVSVFRSNGVIFDQQQAEHVEFTRTDADGRYTFPHVQAGTYGLVSGADSVPAAFPAVYWPTGGHIEEAGEFAVSAGEVRELSTVVVLKAAAITAQLTPESLIPRDKHLDVAFYRQTKPGRWVGISSLSGSPDVAKNAIGLAPGTYRVGFQTAD